MDTLPRLLVGILTVVLAAPVTAQPKKADFKPVLPGVRALGEVAVEGNAVTAKGPVTLLIGDDAADGYRVTADFTPVDSKTGQFSTLAAMPSDPANLNLAAAYKGYITRDADGWMITTGSYRYDTAKKAWGGNHDVHSLRFWPAPTDKDGQKLVADSGLTPRKWKGRPLPLAVEVGKSGTTVWLDGRFLHHVERPTGFTGGPVAITLAAGDRIADIKTQPFDDASLFRSIDLGPDATETLTIAKPMPSVTVGGVPFELAARGAGVLSLRKAGWIEQKTDPADYYEWYDFGQVTLHDPRMPMLRVPSADYVAAHVLAVADDDPNRSDVFTLRGGRYGYAGQVVQHDFAARVPRKAALGADTIDTPAGRMAHVRVPLTTAFAQDVADFMDFELTKEVRLARRQPDPCRFRTRPLGLDCGVRIVALTLEKSPLQMRVSSSESGHAFVEPRKPTFRVALTNLTAKAQPYRLQARATHLDGTPTQAEAAGTAAAGQVTEISLIVPTTKRGYHDIRIMLSDAAGRVLLERMTSFALLPPDTRKHRERSPFGVWDFCGTHFSIDDPDISGPLYVKAGMRYGMFSFSPEKRKQYGILPGNEPVILAGAKAIDDALQRMPDMPPIGLIFHENSISGRHITRVPDLFHDRPPYKLDEAEQKQFQKLWDEAIKGAKEVRAQYPNYHLKFGNGPLPTKEEFYRKKFPTELFDSAGNEAGAFGRPPEAQPPDCIAHNASIWMDRQMLDAYGYKDKPVTQCYEICYPSTNPGNVSLRDQADYLVRHGLHSLAWNIPEIKFAAICDMGNSYKFSNWGAIGLCHSKPEINVKPAFVSVATMTRVLDGVKFVRVVPLGSPSLYGLEFDRADGKKVFALWTLRGKRPVKLTTSAKTWTRIDDQGNESALSAAAGAVTVELTPSPIYLVGSGTVTASEPGTPEYSEKPTGKATVLAPLARLDDWEIEADRNAELEYYNFMCPRRKGDFAFSIADGALTVTPKPIKHGKDTMPMYAVLAHKTGVAVPGTPTEVGVWVNGNSGWGRVMFEFTDASGQRWISIGAKQEGIPHPWLEDMVPKDMLAKFPTPGISDWNTEDVFGLSKINFDGWRYVAFPMPGNYPGEKHPWPANSQWKWDKDGVVKYPLTFRKLIIELPEKVLHVKTFAPPPRLGIGLKNLTVGQDDDWLTTTQVLTRPTGK